MDIESSHLEIMDMERMVQFYLLTHETSHSNLFIYKKEKKKKEPRGRGIVNWNGRQQEAWRKSSTRLPDRKSMTYSCILNFRKQIK